MQKIPGFDNYYATTTGRIFKNEKEVSYRKASGYIVCMVTRENKQKSISVHRLVALTYIPNPENKPQVNHIDSDRANNNVENLEWVTANENMQHAVQNNRMGYHSERVSKYELITLKEIAEIKHLVSKGYDEDLIARFYNLFPAQIRIIVTDTPKNDMYRILKNQ